MLVKTEANLLNAYQKSSNSGRSYNIKNGKIAGFVEGKEALIQSIDRIFRTQKCGFGIYSQNYGVDFSGLFMLEKELMKVRAKSQIEQALLADDRVQAVTDFCVQIIDKSLYMSFTVETIYGDLDYEGVV